MTDLGVPLLLVAAVCLGLVLALAAVGIRRAQLGRALGTFETSICLPSGGWQMGVCRYADNHLEWLRLFSLSPLPRRRFLRSSLEVKGWRQPSETERARFQPGAIVVMLDYEGAELLMAMKFDVYAGLSSWLEAGPVIGIGTWR